MFSFVIYDRTDNSYFAVRDHVGITPLYIGYGNDGSIWYITRIHTIENKFTGRALTLNIDYVLVVKIYMHT